MCYLKRFLDYGGVIILRAHQMVALSELLALISIVFGYLTKHNSENKILIRYHIVWLLVVILSRRATSEAM